MEEEKGLEKDSFTREEKQNRAGQGKRPPHQGIRGTPRNSASGGSVLPTLVHCLLES